MICDSCSNCFSGLLWKACTLQGNKLCSTTEKECSFHTPMNMKVIDLSMYIILYSQWASHEVGQYSIMLDVNF